MMRFLIAFDLPIRDNPEREFEQPTLRAGRVYAKRMELTLRDYMELDHPVSYFLYVHDGQHWKPHYLISEWPDGWFACGWGSQGLGCNHNY